MKDDFGGGEDIRFERRGRAGVVTLTRPKALNALNHRMVAALELALEEWQADDAIALVVIRGEGRAFCAGGDILDVYEGGKAGDPPLGFFADEYRLNAAIARFPKPYVALIDGIVMGGGVGISFHGSHRVMSENAVFAMPETGIGFFTDVGGSHLLPGTPGSFGMYLGLTGERIRRGDAIWAGLATHAVDAGDFDSLLEALAEADDPSAALERYAANVPRERGDGDIDAIAQHLSPVTLDAVVASLSRAADAGETFAQRTLTTLGKRSPTSLNVVFRQIRAGAGLTMDDCMRMEFRILNRMLAGHDFYEGIRAVIVDKDQAPRWHPATLEEVDPSAIDAYFAPLPDGELGL